MCDSFYKKKNTYLVLKGRGVQRKSRKVVHITEDLDTKKSIRRKSAILKDQKIDDFDITVTKFEIIS